MTTERVYKMAMSPFEALKTMTIEMKQSFNKKLLEKFIVFLGY
jgi:HD-GYP domain-containing protein (c-di-GMP phosphodiesterase class II)